MLAYVPLCTLLFATWVQRLQTLKQAVSPYRGDGPSGDTQPPRPPSVRAQVPRPLEPGYQYDTASNCVPALPLNEPVLWIVSYALMSVCGVILLTLIVLLLLPLRCRHLPRDPEVVNDESSLVRHRWK
ncbi:hypothetical protein CB1_001148002 [Camelus ferus]|nr:hypothetical protein CB1_001148002 [Camelus ferus]